MPPSSPSAILVIGATDITGPGGGKQYYWKGFLEFLAELGESHKVIYLDTSMTGNSPKSFPGKLDVRYLGLRERYKTFVGILAGLLGRRSIQESLWSSRSHLHRIRTAIEEHRPSAIVFDTIRVGQYLRDPAIKRSGARLVLLLDDLYSRRYHQLARPDNPINASPIKRTGANLGPLIEKLADVRFLQRAVYSYEARAIERSEKTLVAAATVSSLVSEKEAIETAHDVPGADVRVMPICFDGHSVTPSTKLAPVPELLLIGDWRTPHNTDALRYLSELAPDLRASTGNFVIRLVGKGAPEGYLDALSTLGERFRYDGYVDNLSECYERAWCSLVPVKIYTGIRVKIIEAWSWGVPILTTTEGAAGLPFVDNHNGISFNSPATLLAGIEKISDPERRKKLALAAVSTFQANFLPENAFKAYRALLGIDGQGQN